MPIAFRSLPLPGGGYALRCWRYSRTMTPEDDSPGILACRLKYELGMLAREAIRTDVRRRNAELQRMYRKAGSAAR